MFREAFQAIAYPLAVVTFVCASYPALLTVLSCFALAKRKAVIGRQTPTTRFAILVPAHNEETLIGRLLTSVRDLDYPPELTDVYVVADNCDDDTETIASSLGAIVLTRLDSRRGKGYALAWAMETIDLHRYDAVALVDADSVLAQGFLSVMDERLSAGADAIQGYYSVLETDSVPRALRSASFILMHLIRPLGKSTFGGSAGLKGNGMAFSTSLLSRVGWQSFSVTEDAEQHVRLLEGGAVVEFAPEAEVKGEMPPSLRGSESQNLRWEAGRWQTARRHAVPLLWLGLRRRSLALLDAAAEMLVPPLSIVGGLSVLTLAAGLALESVLLAVIGATAIACLLGHIAGGLLLARAPAGVWKSLLAAPVYVTWKLVLYVRALTGAGSETWVRTPRTPSRRSPS